MKQSEELLQRYDRLFYQSVGSIGNGNVLPDGMIDHMNDNRRGLTLLIRPAGDVKDRIHRFQEEMRGIDEEQYYQPATDLHITVLSIISCYEGFALSEVSLPDYVQVISESIKDIREIGLDCKGITASREAVMIQGFPTDNSLNMLRDRLRKNFGHTELQQSIDSRYPLSTAHITSIRFRKALKAPGRFAAMLQQHRKSDFGKMQAASLELVYNDWYQKNTVVKTLHRFTL